MIGFSVYDGRHDAADEESALIYRMYIVECARSIALRSPLRHRRRHSLVFVVIIADECQERKRRTRQVNAKDRRRKQTKLREYYASLIRPDPNQQLILALKNG